MLQSRVIPVLLLKEESLVKTTRFNKFVYVGDPCNTVRIFNELEVDELLFLDISTSRYSEGPNIQLLKNIAEECFMPLSYGGGIASLSHARDVLKLGFEKIVVNSAAIERPELISEIADQYGSQAIIVSIDVKRNYWGKQTVWTKGGRNNTNRNPIEWAIEASERGAGEILLTSIEREGSWAGYDLELIKQITSAITVPVIANGGCGKVSDIEAVINFSNASAAGLGSMVVFQAKGNGVLVHMPNLTTIQKH